MTKKPKHRQQTCVAVLTEGMVSRLKRGFACSIYDPPNVISIYENLSQTPSIVS
ncbi:hypothetical protein SAMN05216299_1277 [Nitrosospira sp. Nsp14]|nr:hypothetical protein SAMN05216299_1277 [Nitrosospira sp. Nsp14]